MAGDWIKVEVSTPHKAEVLRMAEMLGVSRRECMGILCDFWVWLDANSRTESVPNLSRESLDYVLACPGFAACLECIGWAKWSADGWTMAVVNYGVHNGTSAKTRAYEQRKKKKQRENLSRICPDDLGTREDKIREDIKQDQNLEPRASARSTLYAPTDDHAALARQVGVDCQAEFLRYRDWLAASGKRHRDERAGFRNWLRRAAEMSRPTGPPKRTEERQRVAAAIFGGATDEQRTIDGESQRVA